MVLPLLGVRGFAAGEGLPGTQPLTLQGDLSAQMVAGIDLYLQRETDASIKARAKHWNRDFSSHEAYTRSVAPNRERLAHILGVVDSRDSAVMELASPVPLGEAKPSALVATAEAYDLYAVRWNILRDLHGEGLLFVPRNPPVADIIALPDCDDSPEAISGLDETLPAEAQFARRLADSGCRVLAISSIDRSDTFSGKPGSRHIRISQREFLWRAAYPMGRTVLGYEIQNVLAAIDWFRADAPTRPLGAIGYGEGGAVALYAAALDTRIDATVVSGYFQPREALHTEPIARNVWGLLEMFGDAEIAGLIAPRSLIVEAGRYPETEYPVPGEAHDGAAPGRLAQPPIDDVEREVSRARDWLKDISPAAPPTFVPASENAVGTERTLTAFLKALGPEAALAVPRAPAQPSTVGKALDITARRKRQYVEILQDTQRLMHDSESVRDAFWKNADRTDAQRFMATVEEYRTDFWENIIGPLPKAALPPNPRTRLVYDTLNFTGYEVVLDVFPDVYAYGILLLPKNIQPGEKRPVVVCQHGLEGRPIDVANPDLENPAYHAYACKLADRGFITYAPQNPYIGKNTFRQVLRKAQPLRKSLYSFIVRQHDVTLEWLASLPYVDAERMAFYGLSYGGKTAMRIPPLLDRYCLSICSADYNEWIWKVVSASHRYSYLFTGEYDMPEFNLGNTYNYAEMSRLIFPRPFMVERGHDDGVAPDRWVAYEYARTKRFYLKMGLGDRTEIEFFDGPHSIHGVGTFDFLHRHLNWPPPK